MGPVMHPYSINTDERQWVSLYLAIAALGVSWAFIAVLDATGWRPPIWIEVPGAFTLYGLFQGAFRRWLWKWKPTRFLCRIRTPEICGTWKGSIRSSFDQHAAEHPIEIMVRQDWTEL